MNTIESINLIYRDPNVRGGRPCIIGTDLRVLDLVISKIFGERTPDELAQDYDLSMAEVHTALAYYYCNKDEIDSDIRDDFKRSDELERQGLNRIQKPAYKDVNPERDLAAINSATIAQAVATALEAQAEAIAKQDLKPLEQEVE